MSKHAIVLVGLPASGKSTARAVAAAEGAAANSHHFSTDDLLDDIAKKAKKSYDEVFKDNIKKVTAIAYRELERAIDKGLNIIWDQTNLTKKKRKSIINKLGDRYSIVCLCILPPFTDEQEKELERRLASRVGKTIPPHVIESMRKSFELPTTDEGFDRVFYFDIYGNMVDKVRENG